MLEKLSIVDFFTDLGNEAYEDNFMERAEEIAHFLTLMKRQFNIPNFDNVTHEQQWKDFLCEKRRSLVNMHNMDELVIAGKKLKDAIQNSKR